MTTTPSSILPASVPALQVPPPEIHIHRALVTRAQRQRLMNCRGGTLWFTGLSGAGKSTIARELELRLLTIGVPAYRLDGDNLRAGINANLGFSPDDRAENIRRIAQIARLFADAGLIAIVSAISPFAADRALARHIHEQDPDGPLAFLEIHLDAPLSVCEQRDPKGLYAKARSGALRGMTGIDSPYEIPERPDLRLHSGSDSPSACTQACIDLLVSRNLLAESNSR